MQTREITANTLKKVSENTQMTANTLKTLLKHLTETKFIRYHLCESFAAISKLVLIRCSTV